MQTHTRTPSACVCGWVCVCGHACLCAVSTLSHSACLCARVYAVTSEMRCHERAETNGREYETDEERGRIKTGVRCHMAVLDRFFECVSDGDGRGWKGNSNAVPLVTRMNECLRFLSHCTYLNKAAAPHTNAWHLYSMRLCFLSVCSSIGTLEKQHLTALLLHSTYHTSGVKPIIPCALIETSFTRRSVTRVKVDTSYPSLDVR